MVDNADELNVEWLGGKARVGITAGASAPEVLAQAVIEEFGVAASGISGLGFGSKTTSMVFRLLTGWPQNQNLGRENNCLGYTTVSGMCIGGIMHLTAVFEKVPEGYIGFVEELPGANTQGATLEEVRANLTEAVDLILEANRALAEETIQG